MQKAGVMFFIGWLLCGCSIDSICDDWRAMFVAVVALIVVVLAAAVITGGDE